MTLYRARQWGSSFWTEVAIRGDEEDETGVEAALSSILGSALSTSSLHVQFMNADEEWENLE